MSNKLLIQYDLDGDGFQMYNWLIDSGYAHEFYERNEHLFAKYLYEFVREKMKK